MSIFQRLKSEARYQRSNNKNVHPYSKHVHGEEIVVLPEKPKKKRKIMEVQRESVKTLATLPSANKPSEDNDSVMGTEVDDEEMGEDTDDKPKEPKKIPWGPPEILEHLDQPEVVGNVNAVIANIKNSMNDLGEEKDPATGEKNPTTVVWDHSQSSEGKKSDNNFYVWFETLAAEETRKVMAKENLIYE